MLNVSVSQLFDKSITDLTAMFNNASQKAACHELGTPEKANALSAMDNINAMIAVKQAQSRIYKGF